MNKGELDPQTVVALAALAGSMVGALSSLVSTWIAQRHQDLRDLVQKDLARREVLDSDFITEAARHFLAAATDNLTDTGQLVAPYALLSRIRLTASCRVLKAAEEVVGGILQAYGRPNLTAQQVQIHALQDVDPLQDFSAVCRTELEALRRHSSW